MGAPRWWAVVVSLGLVVAGCGSADDEPAALDRDGLQSLVERFVRVADVPGAVLAVRRGDDVWVGAAGEADPEAGVAMTADAVFPIASITKTFVAALVLQAVDAGRIDLDDRVSGWVPDWPRGDDITVEHLLGHRSGIADYFDDPAFFDALLADLGRRWRPEDMLAFARGLEPHFAPGEGWRYANTNYILLGMLLERVEGKPLGELVEARLTGPRGLDDTALDDGAGQFPERVPHLLFDLEGDGELVDVRGFPRTAAMTSKWAEGGMVSTGADLVDWVSALYGTDEVVAPDVRRRMVDVGEYGYGLGTAGFCPCRGAPRDRLRFSGYGHDGDFYGSRSVAAFWPGSDVAVALLVNQSPVHGRLLESTVGEARDLVGPPDEGF